MLQPPAAQSPQQQHFRKALFTGQLCRILGVGVVLDVGQDDHIFVLRLRAGGRVKIAHHDVGLAPQRHTVAVARIAGDDKIIGAQQGFQLCRDGAGGENNAACHHNPLLCQSFTSFTSSYIAQ